ncbi:MAG: pentapeptide repeat-containing protein [Lachnospiraceae bacterium]|nr:pentapeptide repeat-containing protein [Lachnospiraceae bacterium]
MNGIDGNYAELQAKLKIDCEKCSGLCCVALYCMKTDGFPANKDAGIPCKHLENDFRCDIHSKLVSKNMRGCLAYDCFGAGQKVTQQYGCGMDWKSASNQAGEIFQVFLIVFQLHQMAWYLIEALSLTFDEYLKSDIRELIFQNEQMTAQRPQEILCLDVEKYRQKVNQTLKEVSENITDSPSGYVKVKDFFGKDFKRANLEGKDFSMSLMIAANLEGCNLCHANFLGADMRDANIKNTDLSQSVFLTQMQINSAKGNINTKLPKNLSHPISWQGL